MFDLLLNSIKDFKGSYKRYIVFEILYLLLTSFIFVPLISYIFNRLIIAMGSSFFLNKDIFKIALSYKGIIGLIIIAMIAVIAIFIELGTLIVISQKRFFSKDILISEAIVTCLMAIPKILFFGVLELVFFLLLLIPFIDTPISPVLVEGLILPISVRDAIFNFRPLMVLYIIALFIFLYLHLKWIFALHYIIIEGKGIIKGIKASIESTNKNKIKIVLKLFLSNIIFFALGLMIISPFSFLPRLLNLNINYILENYLLTISSFIAFILTLLIAPINIIFITRLYYQSKTKRNQDISDTLIIRKSKVFEKLENRVSNLFTRRKLAIFIVVVLYLTATFFISMSVSESIIHLGRNISIAAHRGDPIGAPENTISSVRSALEKGVDYVEIDVQITKDGIVVLNHDSNLMRVAGVPQRVSDLTYEEISALDVGGRFSKEFSGEGIPTLEEVLIEVKGRAKLIIEIKPYGDNKALAEAVVSLVEKHEMVEDCYIQSFQFSILHEVRGLNGDIKIGQIFYFSVGNLSRLEVDYYAVDKSILSEALVKNAVKNNRELWVWTVNDESDIREVLKYDINGIITDYPERVQEIIGFDNN